MKAKCSSDVMPARLALKPAISACHNVTGMGTSGWAKLILVIIFSYLKNCAVLMGAVSGSYVRTLFEQEQLPSMAGNSKSSKCHPKQLCWLPFAPHWSMAPQLPAPEMVSASAHDRHLQPLMVPAPVREWHALLVMENRPQSFHEMSPVTQTISIWDDEGTAETTNRKTSRRPGPMIMPPPQAFETDWMYFIKKSFRSNFPVVLEMTSSAGGGWNTASGSKTAGFSRLISTRPWKR
mmetsp:Transcript_28732/g.91550  ORF Transcript_28732/g.91550 Transcript_28732/m.91550 type:complete len:236 (+) Transcript_28732:299-1006(+)